MSRGLARAIEAALCRRYGGTSAMSRVLDAGLERRGSGPWRALCDVYFAAGYIAFRPKDVHASKVEALHALAALGGLKPEDYTTKGEAAK